MSRKSPPSPPPNAPQIAQETPRTPARREASVPARQGSSRSANQGGSGHYPQSFITELKDRLSITEVVGARVSWDLKRSNQARGDYWACCPFHGEKTPSFHVVESKGYYHCFGCGVSGGAIDFVMALDRLNFREAIDQLAPTVGLTPPQPTPEAAAREARTLGLIDAVRAAEAYYQMALRSSDGAQAREYLARRGLDGETVGRFGLGYAPSVEQRGWDGVTRALLAEGFSEETLVEVDLSARRDRDGKLFDRFRHRIIFPILDARGRPIAFGGRAMAADERAKYLNSRTTPLFEKRETLYNFANARAACGRGSGGAGAGGAPTPVIVAEGYMDVLALAQAGFEAAVAPLGTALTEQQLARLWRVCPEPTLALDGDQAGLRAAERAVDLALPKLGPGQTLRFALLPNGLDPDDLIRAQGPEAMARALDAALPMIEMVWRRERDVHALDTPERRAALERRLDASAERIEDATLKREYRFALRGRKFEHFRALREAEREAKTPKRGQPLGRFAARAPRALAETRQNALAGTGANADRIALRGRECALLLSLANHPHLAEAWLEELTALEFLDPLLDRVKAALISAICGDGWRAPPPQAKATPTPSLDDDAHGRTDQGRTDDGLRDDGAPERRVAADGNFADGNLADGNLDAKVNLTAEGGLAIAVLAREAADIGEETLRGVFAEGAAKLPRSLHAGATPDGAEEVFRELLTRHTAEVSWRRECAAYADELGAASPDEDDEPVRLRTAQDAKSALTSTPGRPTASEAEISDRLKSIIENKIWIKRKKPAAS